MTRHLLSVFARTLCGAALILSVHRCSAADLFQVTASNADMLPPISIAAGGPSMPDLLGDLVAGTGSFVNLHSRPLNASLAMGPVQDVLEFNITSAPGMWSARVTSPFAPGLLLRSFTAATRDEVRDQILEYLKEDRLGEMAAWQKAIQGRSAAALMHGNPNSSTALQAQWAFNSTGMAPIQTAEEKAAAPEPAGAVTLSLAADAGTIQAQGFNSRSCTASPAIACRFSDHVRLEASLPVNMTTVEGSEAYRAGLHLALPITILKQYVEEVEKGRLIHPWLWQVTLHGASQASGSADLLAGGILNSAGLTSLLACDFGRIQVSLGNQLTLHESLRLSFDDYRFDPRISTQIIKNGLQVTASLGQRWYAGVYAQDTELLGPNTWVSRYTTLGGQVGYKAVRQNGSTWKSAGHVVAGVCSNLASDWTSVHVHLGAGFTF